MFTHRIDDDLELRLPEVRDAEEIFALINKNRERLKPWLSWPHIQGSVEETKENIRKVRLQYAEGKSLVTFVWHKGRSVGRNSIVGLDSYNRLAELAYWLDEEAEGEGIITRSSRVLIAYCFDNLALERVAIRSHPDNLRSKQVPERLGFTFEGLLRNQYWRHDRSVDQLMYSLLAHEWREQQAKA